MKVAASVFFAGLVALSLADPKSSCERQRDDPSKKGLMGAFRPTCDSDGTFDLVQCHESVCYCADGITGEEKPGSQTHVSQIDQMEKMCKDAMTKCEKARRRIGGKVLIGQSLPQCDESGMFHKRQCHHDNGCHCVDHISGHVIEGSDHTFDNTDACEKTACMNQLEGTNTGLLGAWKAQCDQDHGNFKAVQCKEAVCFCVNRATGQKVGDEKLIGQVKELHESCMTKCEQERDVPTTTKGALGGDSAPRCEANGDYHSVQCREAVCRCVDPKSGYSQAQFPTEKPISKLNQLERQCNDGPNSCVNRRFALRWSKGCSDDCSYYSGGGEAGIYCCCD